MNFIRNSALQIRSRTKPARWEEAMVCGNGVSGLMVMGGTQAETLIVCHEKFEYHIVEKMITIMFEINFGRDYSQPDSHWKKAKVL